MVLLIEAQAHVRATGFGNVAKDARHLYDGTDRYLLDSNDI